MNETFRRPIVASAIIERDGGQVLIVRPRQEEGRCATWIFPRGAVRTGESPEAAMRRIASETLGMSIEIMAGQPPFLHQIDGVDTEMRFFLCVTIEGEGLPLGVEEVRWVPIGALCEFDFDPYLREVIQWLEGG